MRKQKFWQRHPGNWIVGMAVALGSFVQAGCEEGGSEFAVSLQPFYSEVDLQSDPLLAGTWRDKEGDVSFTFEPSAEKEYKLVVIEKEGEKKTSGEFEGHLVRLGGNLFLDFFPKSIEEGGDFYRVHFVRGHSIARIEIGLDSSEMTFLSASWLKRKIEEKSIDTPHEKVDGALLLTGTVEEVQDLVFLHAEEEGAFSEPLTLERQRVEEEIQ
jgi:hypothetical protein